MFIKESKVLDTHVNSAYPITGSLEGWENVIRSGEVFHVVNKNILIEFDLSLKSRVYAKFDGRITNIGDFSESHFVCVNGAAVTDFTPKRVEGWTVNDDMGSGRRYAITAYSQDMKGKIEIAVYDAFPATAFFKATYTNTSSNEINITGWTSNSYRISAGDAKGDILFWSYQSGSYESRPDWVLPLKKGFSQENYMGMNALDYGGGTPVSDVWRKDAGIAVGHVETKPLLVSLPVDVPDDGYATLGVCCDNGVRLKPGEGLTTFDSFATVHRGDYFKPLSEYREIMVRKGINFEKVTWEAYSPTWCAWGYERNFRLEQIYGALPMVKKLGLKWVCLDDGWQTEEGDYTLIKEKFPNGDKDMRAFVDTVHSQGLKAQLWWIPLAVDPKSELFREHPEYVISDEKGKPGLISWWDSYYMCPAYEDVKENTREALKKILIEWDFDGLKIDGQHLNAAPPCHNESHAHAYPEQSYEAMPEFFKMVYDMAREIKPNVIVMFCPCGTGYSFFTMPYYNEPVASDPLSSWQVRTKGKVFKALMGPSTAFHGDHVELSDNENDFASTVGIGGVIDTKFTWPVGSAEVSILKPDSTYDLDNEKEAFWKKWLDLYNEKMLPEGEYRGELYTTGYDLPEGHAVKKDDKMYYAFYSPDWDGEIELRGLEDRMYSVYDYVNNRRMGTIKGPSARIAVSFRQYLLIEVCAL